MLVAWTATPPGLARRSRDPATTVIVLVSKPPDPDVADRLLGQAADLGKPVVAAFVGGRPSPRRGDALSTASTLEGAAHLALRVSGSGRGEAGSEVRRWRAETERRARTVAEHFAPSQRYLRGLYSGGTLCAECAGVLESVLTPLYTNVHAGAARPVGSAGRSQGHTLLDLGDDVFTVGRLHPMLDMTLRAQRLGQEAADPEVAAILLDVVLGEGVHPDPAGALVPAITASRRAAEERGRHLAVVASVCGTDGDPQNRSRQVERLEEAGVLVEDTNARASALAGALATRGTRIPALDVGVLGGSPGGRRGGAAAGSPGDSGSGEARLLSGPLRVVNVGLPIFAESLRAQDVEVIDVDWRPPAGGDRAMVDLLERLG
jgi:FdrA protein